MNRTEIIDLLSTYKVNKARAQYLDQKCLSQQEYIERLRQTALQDSIHITQNLFHTPSGNDHSSPVENLAINVADGHLPSYIIEEYHQLSQMQLEAREAWRKVKVADCLLDALTDKERYVIEGKYVNDIPFTHLEKKGEQQFGYYISIEGIRKIRNSALIKLCQVCD